MDPKLDTPIVKQESFWLTLVAVCTAAAPILDQLVDVVPNDWRPTLIAVAAICAAIAGRRARTPGAEARAAQGGPEVVQERIDAVKKAAGQ